jgi:hypothetical protein
MVRSPLDSLPCVIDDSEDVYEYVKLKRPSIPDRPAPPLPEPTRESDAISIEMDRSRELAEEKSKKELRNRLSARKLLEDDARKADINFKLDGARKRVEWLEAEAKAKDDVSKAKDLLSTDITDLQNPTALPGDPEVEKPQNDEVVWSTYPQPVFNFSFVRWAVYILSAYVMLWMIPRFYHWFASTHLFEVRQSYFPFTEADVEKISPGTTTCINAIFLIPLGVILLLNFFGLSDQKVVRLGKPYVSKIKRDGRSDVECLQKLKHRDMVETDVRIEWRRGINLRAFGMWFGCKKKNYMKFDVLVGYVRSYSEYTYDEEMLSQLMAQNVMPANSDPATVYARVNQTCRTLHTANVDRSRFRDSVNGVTCLRQNACNVAALLFECMYTRQIASGFTDSLRPRAASKWDIMSQMESALNSRPPTN